MTADDWYDPNLGAIGMFVSGAPLRSPGPRGEQQVDKSFVLWFNSDEHPQRISLPENDWVQTGEVVISTDAELPAGTPVEAGDKLCVGPRTVVVIREH
jgi:glycogen operon protein